jgi:hypothetical protein
LSKFVCVFLLPLPMNKSIARILKIIADKLAISANWLPSELKCLSPREIVELVIQLEKTVADEIVALARKEEAIAKKIRVSKDLHRKGECSPCWWPCKEDEWSWPFCG